MRRFLTGFVVAAVTAVVPVLALAGNQEVAEQIARNLRNSGQMSDYKVGVKFQDGTVWLRGHVSSPEQMKAALALVYQTPGVTRVVNELSAGSSQSSQPAAPAQVASKEATGSATTPARDNPLRGSAAPAAEKAQPQQLSLAKRMEAVVSRGSEQQASQPLPMAGSTLARADRVPNSFAMSAVEPVSAEESREAPQAIETPQRAKPMSKAAARGTTQVAMMQQGPRGPAAPDGGPMPMYSAANRGGVVPARYDQPCLPNYAWPSYAAYPNYAGVTYPKQYSPTAWPYIGPFYPYPQVPLGWRKVTLEWDSGWWFLDFKDQPASCWHR